MNIKTFILLVLVTGLIIYPTNAQDVQAQKQESDTTEKKVDTIFFESKKGLVSQRAFSKKIAKDFSYFILGANSTQQGLSATVNEKGTSIKINGLIYSGKLGILNVEADLSSTNGVYFFDDNKGGERAKITLNYYKNLGFISTYRSGDNLSTVNNQLKILELIVGAKSKYENLKVLVKDNIIPEKPIVSKNKNDEDSTIRKELVRLTRIYVNSQDIDGFDRMKKREPNLKPYKVNNIKPQAVVVSVKNEDNKEKISYKIKLDSLNISKLVADFQQIKHYILNELEDVINNAELENADDLWKGSHMGFVGISPFYQRESINRFTYNDTLSFSDMFAVEKGDVYGVTVSFNYSYEKYNNPSRLAPQKFLAGVAFNASRTSNISSFRNSTLNYSSTLGDDVNGNPVEFTNTNQAFIGDKNYEYGAGIGVAFQMYYYPSKLPLGLFGRVGYEHINFSRYTNIKDKELSPLRLGVQYDIKNTMSIQFFMDRSDLSLNPNGNDNDLRFGLGLGVPINFK